MRFADLDLFAERYAEAWWDASPSLMRPLVDVDSHRCCLDTGRALGDGPETFLSAVRRRRGVRRGPRRFATMDAGKPEPKSAFIHMLIDGLGETPMRWRLRLACGKDGVWRVRQACEAASPRLPMMFGTPS